MSYCAPEAFIGIFGERETINLSNLDEPTATTVNTARLQQALDDASEEIDTYLQERYDPTQLRATGVGRLVTG